MVKEQYGGLLTEDGMGSREWSNDLNANDGTEDFVLWNDAERRTKHGLGIHGVLGLTPGSSSGSVKLAIRVLDRVVSWPLRLPSLVTPLF